MSIFMFYCCRKFQTGKIYWVKPSRIDVFNQIAIYLEKCCNCLKPVLKIIELDILGQNIGGTMIRGDKAKKIFNRLEIISKVNEYSHSNVYSKFSLKYNHFGKKKKCYQNLSSLKTGNIEGDPLYHLIYLKKTISEREKSQDIINQGKTESKKRKNA